MKNKYLVALPSFRGSKGFNHRTILVKAINKEDAKSLAYYLTGQNIGDVKKVDY